jgi:hypothetical protein
MRFAWQSSTITGDADGYEGPGLDDDDPFECFALFIYPHSTGGLGKSGSLKSLLLHTLYHKATGYLIAQPPDSIRRGNTRRKRRRKLAHWSVGGSTRAKARR